MQIFEKLTLINKCKRQIFEELTLINEYKKQIFEKLTLINVICNYVINISKLLKNH